MSYNISLFRKETKLKEQTYIGDNFFEDDGNLEPFTQEQINRIKDRLLKYKYTYMGKNTYGQVFEHEDFGESLLSDEGLYFSTSNNFDSIFEVGLMASEFTDTDELAKYDPQAGGWEEV